MVGFASGVAAGVEAHGWREALAVVLVSFGWMAQEVQDVQEDAQKDAQEVQWESMCMHGSRCAFLETRWSIPARWATSSEAQQRGRRQRTMTAEQTREQTEGLLLLAVVRLKSQQHGRACRLEEQEIRARRWWAGP